MCLVFAASRGVPGEQQPGHNSIWVWALVSFSRLSLRCQRPLLSPGLLQQPPDCCVPASASAQPSTLKAAAFETGQIVSSFAQNFQWLPSKSQGPQSGLQGPLSLLTHLPTFPDSLHCSCTVRLPISRAFAECSLCPEARPPALCKPPPSSSLGLCSNVTFSARPSQTACFLSPGSSFSPRHSHADTVCLLSVCLHTSLRAPRRWSFYSITFPGVDAEPGTVSSLRWLPNTVVSVSQGLLMLRTGVLTVFGSRHSLHWSRHGLLLFM